MFFAQHGARVVALVIAALAAQAASAQQPAWFDPAVSTRVNAEAAARNNVPPANATQVILDAGDDPAHAVQAVISAYNRCDAVSESVRVATAGAPARAGDIVQAATASGRCPCSNESLWSQSRLQHRLRVEQRAEPVQVAAFCGCTAIAAEAAVATAPDRADEVLDAALLSQRRAEAVVDSLGQVGATRGPGSEADALTRVDTQRCTRDVETQDAFTLGTMWQSGTQDPSMLTPDLVRCDDEHGHREGPKELVLAAYVATANDHALVLYNGTDQPVALGSENYQVDLYFPDARDPGRRVALNGKVAPGAYYVVTGRGAAPAWLDRADQTVAGTLLAPSEAVVLRRGATRGGCDCAQAAVAGTVNGLGPAAPDWVEAHGGDAGATRLVTADSVGQTRPEATPAAQWQSPLAPAPLALARVAPECESDRITTDPFATGTTWQPFESATAPAPPRCVSTPGNVLLAGFRAWPAADGDAPPRAVNLYNATGANVDLARDGYVLEVYADGDEKPQRVVKLDGQLAAGQALAVATPSVAQDQLPERVVRASALDAPRLDAVVLRRLAARSDAVCPIDVYAAVRIVGDGPVVIAAGPPTDVDGEPRSDELPIDPDRGGDIASPN